MTDLRSTRAATALTGAADALAAASRTLPAGERSELVRAVGSLALLAGQDPALVATASWWGDLVTLLQLAAAAEGDPGALP